VRRYGLGRMPRVYLGRGKRLTFPRPVVLGVGKAQKGKNPHGPTREQSSVLSPLLPVPAAAAASISRAKIRSNPPGRFAALRRRFEGAARRIQLRAGVEMVSIDLPLRAPSDSLVLDSCSVVAGS
jgi:hypothetical protein